MSRARLRWGWLLAICALAACATTQPSWSEIEFRLAGFNTMIIGTERFVEAVRRLGYEQDIAFRELPIR